MNVSLIYFLDSFVCIAIFNCLYTRGNIVTESKLQLHMNETACTSGCSVIQLRNFVMKVGNCCTRINSFENTSLSFYENKRHHKTESIHAHIHVGTSDSTVKADTQK